MNKGEFVEQFRLELALLPVGEPTPKGFENYLTKVTQLQSDSVRELRENGVPGYIRAEYNDAIAWYKPDYKEYLYKVSNKCCVCKQVMATIKEVTIDHIKPKGAGGARGIINQQLAHADCNILKDADFNKKTGQHLLPRKRKKKIQPLSDNKETIQ